MSFLTDVVIINGPVYVDASLVDNKDGTYIVSYRCCVKGLYLSSQSVAHLRDTMSTLVLMEFKSQEVLSVYSSVLQKCVLELALPLEI